MSLREEQSKKGGRRGWRKGKNVEADVEMRKDKKSGEIDKPSIISLKAGRAATAQLPINGLISDISGASTQNRPSLNDSPINGQRLYSDMIFYREGKKCNPFVALCF